MSNRPSLARPMARSLWCPAFLWNRIVPNGASVDYSPDPGRDGPLELCGEVVGAVVPLLQAAEHLIDEVDALNHVGCRW